MTQLLQLHHLLCESVVSLLLHIIPNIRIIYPKGTSLLAWKLRHNTHHACTNEVGNDPDIKLSPALHFFENFDPSHIQAFQHWYYLPFIGVLHIYWHVESWMGTAYHWNSRNSATRSLARWDAVAMFLHWCWIGVMATYCGMGVGPLLLCYYLSGLSTAIVVFSSHYGEERLEVIKAKDGEVGVFASVLSHLPG